MRPGGGEDANGTMVGQFDRFGSIHETVVTEGLSIRAGGTVRCLRKRGRCGWHKGDQVVQQGYGLHIYCRRV